MGANFEMKTIKLLEELVRARMRETREAELPGLLRCDTDSRTQRRRTRTAQSSPALAGATAASKSAAMHRQARNLRSWTGPGTSSIISWLAQSSQPKYCYLAVSPGARWRTSMDQRCAPGGVIE